MLPQVVDPDQIVEAGARIARYARVTPTLVLEDGIWGASGRLALKLELLQQTGSFKLRGAFNRMLSQQIPESGVIAASGGNHGLAVAHAARVLGHHAEIFVPEVVSAAKLELLRGLGAEVRVVGGVYSDALAAAERRASETGGISVHAYDQPEVVAGQGTVAMELVRQLPEVDTCLVAVGGGGLLAGVTGWFKKTVRVVAVEAEGCATLAAALTAGEPVDIEVGGLAADSLGATRIGEIAFRTATEFAVESVVVPEDQIVRAQRALWDHARVLAELGGAAALAAVISGAYKPERGEVVAAIVCGGNTDPCLN